MDTKYYNMVRTVFVPEQSTFTITIPDNLISKRLELLILPMDFDMEANTVPIVKDKRSFQLTTYKCQGKFRNFTRADAYSKQ